MAYYTKPVLRREERKKGMCWRAIIKHKDAQGKWKQKTKVMEATGKRAAKEEAEKWWEVMEKAVAKVPNAAPRVDSKFTLTLAEVCENYYRHQLVTEQVEKSTFSMQMHKYNKWVKPYLGNYDFNSVDRVVINDWLTFLYTQGLSTGYIHGIYSMVAKVYNYFYMIGDIERNPFDHVKTPQKSPSRETYLDPAMETKFFDAINQEYEEGNEYWTAFNLAFFAGLRRGEILGLRWNNVDFTARTLSITTAIGYSSDGGYAKAPKNKSSIRTIPMVNQLYEVLMARKEVLGEVKGNWYVCGDHDEFMSKNDFSKEFKRIVYDYDITDHYGKYVTPHMLRHNFAFRGIRANMDIASLSSMMGHASRAMTLDTYGDASEQASRLAAKQLEKKFEDDLGF